MASASLVCRAAGSRKGGWDWVSKTRRARWYSDYCCPPPPCCSTFTRSRSCPVRSCVTHLPLQAILSPTAESPSCRSSMCQGPCLLLPVHSLGSRSFFDASIKTHRVLFVHLSGPDLEDAAAWRVPEPWMPSSRENEITRLLMQIHLFHMREPLNKMIVRTVPN
jgi:hypothetical protein